ncbi:hypothetical protein [Streptomyces chilikensis]|uniref:hypothetical protein n=1 Tax=Streptomyces chilikensis TaxID=1194079 RepID=UPI000A59B652|nr:hypothetical protein [Streptomyces chilikensis]
MTRAYSPIPELNLLKEFEERIGPVYYSDGFELMEYGGGASAGTWSEDPEFLGRLIPFAQANGSGSEYAVWRCDDRADLATLPVVLLGDEGELYVIAADLRELFRLLAVDSEPLVDIGFLAAAVSEPEGGEGEGRQHSQGHREFLVWLEETFGLRPPSPEDLRALWDGRKELDARFRAWAGRFVELHEN